MDKSHEQARLTRQQNKAAREAARAVREEQERQDKDLVLNALRAVLQDPEATAAQRIYAIAVLDAMQYYRFVPYDVKHPGTNSDEVIADFAERLKEYEAASNK